MNHLEHISIIPLVLGTRGKRTFSDFYGKRSIYGVQRRCYYFKDSKELKNALINNGFDGVNGFEEDDIKDEMDDDIDDEPELTIRDFVDL